MNVRQIAYWLLLTEILLAEAVEAHDLRGMTQTRNGNEIVVQQVLATADARTRQVLQRLNLWPSGNAVVVCFIGGNDAFRTGIRTIANEWTSGDALKFDFGGPTGRDCSGTDKEDIRVGFTSRAGDWSWIGVESHEHSGASLNLDPTIDDPSGGATFRSDVLHEFGHAIGFWHEQQHPDAVCDYDKALIESDFGWDDGTYDVNMKKVERDERKFIFSLYDKKSVMHYSIAAKYFLSGASSPCYIPLNSVLSSGDLNAVRAAYPPQVAGNPADLDRGVEVGALNRLRGNLALRPVIDRRLRVLAGELQ